MAPSNRTTSTPPKLVVTLPSLRHSTLQWHPAMATSNGITSTPPEHTTMAPCNGTQQWHCTHSPTIPHYNGTLQWHQAMALRYVHSPNHSPLEWHPAMAPSNGTTSTPPKLVVTLSSPHHSTRQWVPPPKWFVALPPIGSKNPYSYRYLGIK